jgi:hypothetical protein
VFIPVPWTIGLGTFGIQSNKDFLIQLEEDFTEPSVLTLGSFAIQSNKDFLIELEEDFTNTPEIELGSYSIRSNSDFLIEYEEDFTNTPEIELGSYPIRSNSDFLIELEEDFTNTPEFTLGTFDVRSYQRPPVAPTFVAVGTEGTGTNPTVTVPSSVAGDMLIITSVVGANDDSIPTPAGWTLAGLSNNNSHRLVYFYKIRGASESSVTLTAASTACRAVMAAYRNVASIDVVGSFNQSVGTSASTLSQTTQYDNDVVISAYVSNSNIEGSTTWGVPAATTVRYNAGSGSIIHGLLIVDEIKVTAGATTPRTATLTASRSWTAGTISLRGVPAIV